MHKISTFLFETQPLEPVKQSSEVQLLQYPTFLELKELDQQKIREQIDKYEQDVSLLKKIKDKEYITFRDIQDKVLQYIDAVEQGNVEIAKYFYEILLLNSLIALALGENHEIQTDQLSYNIENHKVDHIIKEAKRLEAAYYAKARVPEEESSQEEKYLSKKELELNGICIKQGQELNFNFEQIGTEIMNGFHKQARNLWPVRQGQAKMMSQIIRDEKDDLAKQLQKLREKQQNLLQLINDQKSQQLNTLSQFSDHLEKEIQKIDLTTMANEVQIPQQLQQHFKPSSSSFNYTLQISNNFTEMQQKLDKIAQNIPDSQDVNKISAKFQLKYSTDKYFNLEQTKQQLNQFEEQSKKLKQLVEIANQSVEAFKNKNIDKTCEQIEKMMEIDQQQQQQQQQYNSSNQTTQLLSTSSLQSSTQMPIKIVNPQKSVPGQLIMNPNAEIEKLSIQNSDSTDIEQMFQQLNVSQLKEQIQQLQNVFEETIDILNTKLQSAQEQIELINSMNTPQNQALTNADLELDKLNSQLEFRVKQLQSDIERQDQELKNQSSQQSLLKSQAKKTGEILILMKEMFCPVCLSSVINTMLDCGHFYCEACVHKMGEQGKRNQKCFICKQNFNNFIKMMNIGLK